MVLLIVGGLFSLMVAGFAAGGMAESNKVGHGLIAVGVLFVFNILIGLVCGVQ